MSNKNLFWGTYEKHIDKKSRVCINKDYKELITLKGNRDIILYKKSDRASLIKILKSDSDNP